MTLGVRLRPGVPALVFGVVLAMSLVGGRTAFLNDPGTFWHVQLGREILQTGSIPRVDGFTYTRNRVAWVDQSWLFDVGLAALVDNWGLSASVAAAALLLAWLYGALAHELGREGVSPLVAGVVAILAAGVGSIHFLVRPHLFTFVGVAWTLWACRRYHETGSRLIWTVPAVVALWSNLHGGFLAGPIVVGCAALGHAISGPWDPPRIRRLRGFAAVLLASVLAPLANPYGMDLYRHVFELLGTNGLTSLIDEYQPPPFGQGKVMVLEWFLLALVALPSLTRVRVSRYDLVHILAWMHFTLAAVRQAPLFAIAAAPGLAVLFDGLLQKSPDGSKQPAGLARWSLWPAIVSLALACSVLAGMTWGRLDPKAWPLVGLRVLDSQPVNARMFHEQDWGGLIEAECRPHRPAFLDDRFELFGKQVILDYVAAMQGGPGWDELDGRMRFDLVWLRPDRPLARRLLADPRWQVVSRDRVSVLLKRSE